MASRIFDLPVPLRPVIALNSGSQPEITVLVAYDLNPSSINSSIYILRRISGPEDRSTRRGNREGVKIPPNN